jgi:hypothetical protein
MDDWCGIERVHCCNLFSGLSAAVSVALHQPVALTVFWMALAILFVVAGVALVPLFLAIALVGLVVRIAQEFILLPLSLSGTLTFLFAAISLILHTRIGLEVASAMNALDGPAHGCPPRNDNHNAPHPVGKGRGGRKSREVEGFCMRKRKKRQLAGFWADQAGWLRDRWK